MKIRSDFVTNSSTAAYVLYGFEVNAEIAERVEEMGINAAFLYGDEDGLEPDKIVIGKYIAKIYNNEISPLEVRDLADFVKPVTDLHRKVGATSPIKLYIGTKMA